MNRAIHELLIKALLCILLMSASHAWAQNIFQPLFPTFVQGEDISANVRGLDWTYRSMRVGWAVGKLDKRDSERLLRKNTGEVIQIPKYGHASLLLRWHDIYPSPQTGHQLLGGLIVGFGKFDFNITVDVRAFGSSRTGVNDEIGFRSNGSCTYEAEEDEDNCLDNFNWVTWLSHGTPRAVIESDEAEESDQGNKVHVVKMTPGTYILTMSLRHENTNIKQWFYPVAVGDVSEQDLRRAQVEAQRLARGSSGDLQQPESITSTGCITGNCESGRGTYVSPGGGRYEGQFMSGMFDGQGTLISPDGTTYTGQWYQGKQHGQGSFKYSDGGEYQGQWYSGIQQGQGNYIFPDGSKYEGQWHEGKQHGPGIYSYSNGGEYDGQFRNGKYDGRATLTTPDGIKITGNFKDGMFTGR